MRLHPLIDFEIQKYYQNESRFNGVYYRNNLPAKIKDGACVINFDEYRHENKRGHILYCFIL